MPRPCAFVSDWIPLILADLSVKLYSELDFLKTSKRSIKDQASFKMLDCASQSPSTTKPSTPNFFRWFSASFCKQASAPNPTKLGCFQMTKGGPGTYFCNHSLCFLRLFLASNEVIHWLHLLSQKGELRKGSINLDDSIFLIRND